MPNPSNRKSAADPNFLSAIEVMNNLGVPYWACHGTLLGLIRDNDLIASDHDIDFAVWKFSISRSQVLQAFRKEGFIENTKIAHASIHFERAGGRKVDINFYEEFADPEFVCVLWRVSRNSILTRLLVAIIEDNEVQTTTHAILRKIKFLRIFALPLYRFLSKKNILHHYRGYINPKQYLENFKLKTYYGHECCIPADAEQILEFMYGVDWRTPITAYDWTRDSPAVVTRDFPLS